MSATTAQNALIQRLQTMPDRPAIAYPNGPHVELPRIVIEVPGAAQRGFGTDGSTLSVAEIVARVEIEANALDAGATAITDGIVAHFPPGLSLAGAQIREAPQSRARYTADGVYHIPVVIRGEIIF